jgi:uroporphyrinogen-III synthase
VIRAAEGSDELIDELRRRGGDVDLGIAYRNVAVESDLDELRSLIESRSIDVVTFTSASTVDHFFGHLHQRLDGRSLLRTTHAVRADGCSGSGEDRLDWARDK